MTQHYSDNRLLCTKTGPAIISTIISGCGLWSMMDNDLILNFRFKIALQLIITRYSCATNGKEENANYIYDPWQIMRSKTRTLPGMDHYIMRLRCCQFWTFTTSVFWSCRALLQTHYMILNVSTTWKIYNVVKSTKPLNLCNTDFFNVKSEWCPHHLFENLPWYHIVVILFIAVVSFVIHGCIWTNIFFKYINN